MISLDEILMQNEKLVYSIINKFGNYKDKEDLYQVGMIGLINAYKNYDKSKNTKFSSYAYFYILGEIKKYLRDSLGIKVDRKTEHLYLLVEKANILLTQKLMHYPSDQELATFLNIDLEQLREIKNSKILIDSLDQEKDELSLYDRISYDEVMYNPEILDLRKELDNLSDFDRKLIQERYYEDKTQQETSIELGINQVKVCKSERIILQRLKERL